VPTPGTQFISQVELVIEKTVGRIVGRSIVQNQLKKLQKPSDALSPADCSLVSTHVVTALSLFVTKQEMEAAKLQLDTLVKHLC
jgi:hypothetical protein